MSLVVNRRVQDAAGKWFITGTWEGRFFYVYLADGSDAGILRSLSSWHF